MTTQGADLRIGEFGIAALGTAAMTKSHELGAKIDACSFADVRYAMAEIILFPRQVYFSAAVFPLKLMQQ
jgi:hypothetical protein